VPGGVSIAAGGSAAIITRIASSSTLRAYASRIDGYRPIYSPPAGCATPCRSPVRPRPPTSSPQLTRRTI
jgi:hypothetical protein